MKPSTISESKAKSKIPITKPSFGPEEVAIVAEVLKSGWVVQGPKVAEFERLFTEFTGAKHAIATTSCTTALHLALLTAGIGQGDRVLLPSLTYVASANAIKYVGAEPLFVDIDRTTFTISIDDLKQKIADYESAGHLKAVMPVSLFGLCCDMPAINRLAEKHNLIVIEDAACAIGGLRDGHHAGTEALSATFSFHPRKAISTGEGGMLITDDRQIADQARRLRDHGASKTDLERHFSEGGSLLPEFNEIGFNYRMTDLQGGLGVVQMQKLPDILTARRRLTARYDKLLADNRDLQTPSVPKSMTHGYQSYVCLFRPPASDNLLDSWAEIQRANQARNRLMAGLEAEGISVRQGTHAVHTLGFYKKEQKLSETDFPASFMADRLSITLPLYPDMTDSDQDRVVAAINRLRASI